MKKIIALTILNIIALSAVAQGVKFESTTHDFGTIQESGGTVSHTFSFTNKTGEPLVIVDVAVSCGCTTPRFSRSSIAPNENSEITIEFDPNNRPGRINKQVVVVTNDGNYKLLIDGIVNPRPRSLAERYPFTLSGGARLDGLGHFALQVPLGKEVTTEIGIANGGTGVPLTLGVDQKKLPPGLSVSVSSELLSAGAQGMIKIRVRGTAYGEFSYRLPLIINGRPTAENITIGGAVVDDFGSYTENELMEAARAKFSTFYCRLGTISVGKPTSTAIEITNIGKNPLVIRNIESSSQIKATADRTTILSGGTAKLNIIYTQPQRGYDSGYLRLIVNDPSNPTPEIRFVATVE